MAAPGWWDVHRQLQKGSRGADVTALQRKLIEDSGDPLPVSSVFDDATEKAVKDFQRRNELAQDGIVGPITFSILFDGNYRFQLPAPKLMHDVEWTCWAAATESVLQSNWSRGRKPLTVADMLATYKDFLLSSKAIAFQGLDKLVTDIGAFQKILSPKEFPLLLVNRLQVY
ncbi:MAG: peptidoglycan-binding domain-containing protein [Roseiarcus sp.]